MLDRENSLFICRRFARQPRLFEWLVTGLVVVSLCGAGLAEPHAAAPWPEERARVFFQDAFREALRGAPPEPRRSHAIPQVSDAGATSQTPAATPADRPAWSGWIAADVLEDEVKRTIQGLVRFEQASRLTASQKSKRRVTYLAHLALLFGVVGDYDQAVRWKSQGRAISADLAKSLRQHLDTPVVQPDRVQELVFQLQDLVRGARWPGRATGSATWDARVHRPTVMRRMEIAFAKSIKPASVDRADAKSDAARVRHECQVLACLAQSLCAPGVEYRDEEDYAVYCQTLLGAAQRVQQALERDDVDTVRGAVKEIQRACDDCHQNYRG